jgi:hypothetical protein
MGYAFSGINVDYAMLLKIYCETSEAQKRYSPAECIGRKRETVIGNPDPKYISTSFAEGQNLSVRMGLRRYTRLTNAFSRKIENHSAAVALYYFAYNFIKIHGTATLHARHGLWRYGSAVGSVRLGGPTGSRRTGVGKSRVISHKGAII